MAEFLALFRLFYSKINQKFLFSNSSKAALFFSQGLILSVGTFWQEASCYQYTAEWTCRLVSVGSLGEGNYNAETEYERK